MTLKCLGSGSQQGNCYFLSTDTETLILDCGVDMKKIKIGLDFDIKRVVGVCVTHHHTDHSESVEDFKRMGIQMFAPYENPIKERIARRFGSFKVVACPMLDKEMQIWQHTNGDGTECPCYAFLIEVNGLKIFYVTDTKLCTWDFEGYGLTHMILGCDYDDEMLSADDFKREHVLRGHLSTAYCQHEILEKYKTDKLQAVYLGHISEDNNDKHICVEKIQEAAGSGIYVDYAAAGKEWILRAKDECPF